ncbi:MAG: formyltransferase family protein [Vicingaceae bacterium]
MSKLKVYIISQEEPFFIPKIIQFLASEQNERFEIIGASRLKPHRKNKTMGDWLKERIKIYTLWELLIASSCVFYCKLTTKLRSMFGLSSPYSVKSAYLEHRIPEIETEDLNSLSYIEKLKKLDIDLLISISPPQIFKKQLLEVPKLACLNAHGTLLPKHRGVFGSWWMLFNKDEEIGTTIHAMEERLDAGEIVFQRAIEMPDDATQYSIAYTTKKIMAKGLLETIEKYAEDKINPIPPSYEESYHRAPTKEQGKQFHQKGLRVIKLKDMKYALSNSFKF